MLHFFLKLWKKACPILNDKVGFFVGKLGEKPRCGKKNRPSSRNALILWGLPVPWARHRVVFGKADGSLKTLPIGRIGNPCDPWIILKTSHFVWSAGLPGYIVFQASIFRCDGCWRWLLVSERVKKKITSRSPERVQLFNYTVDGSEIRRSPPGM